MGYFFFQYKESSTCNLLVPCIVWFTSLETLQGVAYAGAFVYDFMVVVYHHLSIVSKLS